jgi:hypothetical protein
VIPQDKEYLLKQLLYSFWFFEELVSWELFRKQIKVINKTLDYEYHKVKRLKVIKNNVLTLLCNKCKLQYEEIAFWRRYRRFHRRVCYFEKKLIYDYAIEYNEKRDTKVLDSIILKALLLFWVLLSLVIIGIPFVREIYAGWVGFLGVVVLLDNFVVKKKEIDVLIKGIKMKNKKSKDSPKSSC